MGLSYGGWAANWLAGTSRRFARRSPRTASPTCQAAHAVSASARHMTATIGYGPVVRAEAALCGVVADPPCAERMTAPMLMLQGEADRICPIDDN